MTQLHGRWHRLLVTIGIAAPWVLAVFVAAHGQVTPAASLAPEVVKWGFIAAALVTGMCALGAAYAVAVIGGAAMGAVAEKPETAGRALVFLGLAEGIAI